MATVLKTVVAQVTVGSNPTPTAIDTDAERCESGRSGLPAKQLYRRLYRGFESHPLRHYCAPIAQWIEHLTTDQKAGGSNPLGRSIFC